METSLLKNKMLFILKGTAAKVPQVGTETVIKQWNIVDFTPDWKSLAWSVASELKH